MARPLRLDFAAATWHLYNRGNNRQDIFLDARDRRKFLELVGETVRRYKWIVYEYELMTNHFHLVLDTPEPTLSRGMQWLESQYAQWFNKHHKRDGHLLKGRFGGSLIEKEAELLNVCRYVALNSVRARMVERPEDYRWGSFRAHLGLARRPWWLATAELLGRLAPDMPIARGLYRTFVHDKIGDSRCIWDDLVGQLYLGSKGWIDKMRARVESKPRSDDHPRPQREIGRPPMHAIVKAVASTFGVSEKEVQRRGRSQARRAAAWLGCYEGLLRRRSIAAGLRLASSGRASDLIALCDRELERDRSLQTQIDRCCELLRASPPPPLTILTASAAVLR